MSTIATEAPALTLTPEDGSLVEESSVGIISTSLDSIGKLVKSAHAAGVKLTEMRLAVAIFWGYVVIHSRTSAGDIPWNLGDAPDVVRAIRDRLSEIVGAEASDEIMGAAVKQQWNRVVREALLQQTVLDSQSPEIVGKVSMSTPLVSWGRALKHLPDEIVSALPGNLGSSYAPMASFPQEVKREMAKAYKAAGLSVPEIYGGDKKPSGGSAAKREASAEVQMETVAVTVANTGRDGGPSVRSVLLGILRVESALAVSLAANAAGEIVDRPACEEIATRIGTVHEIASRVIAGEYDPDKDAATLASVAFDPKTDK